MSKFTLRAARSTDAGKAGAILSEFVDQTPWLPRLHTRAEDISFVASMIDKDWVTVILKDHLICGFLAREAHEVHALYVAKHAWRQGGGAVLLRQAQVVSEKLSLWTFQANIAAHAFYFAQGFIEVERTTGDGNDEKLPDIRLKWKREVA